MDPHEKKCQEAGKPFFLLLFLHVILSSVLIFFTPESVLQYEFARKLISLPATIAPAFMDVPPASRNPDVVRFYFGIMWLLYPGEVLLGFLFYFRIPVSCLMRKERMISYKSRSRSLLKLLLYSLIVIYSWYHSVYYIYSPIGGRFSTPLYLSRATMCYGSTLYTLGLLLGPVLVFMYGHILFCVWRDVNWFSKKQ